MPATSASRSVKKQAPCASRARIAVVGGLAGRDSRGRRRRAEHGASSRKYSATRPRAAPERTRRRPRRPRRRRTAGRARRRVGADAARQHVALPHLGRQRQALERDQRLAQAVDPGARRRVAVDALPARQEARERALVGGLDLLAQRGERGAPQPAQHLGVAPLARVPPGAARRGRARRRARAPREHGRQVQAVARRAARAPRTGRACARSGGRAAPSRPARRR